MFTLGTALSNQIDANWQTYVMIIVYFIILLIIGFYGYRQATGNLSEFMLGDVVSDHISQLYQLVPLTCLDG